MRPLRTLLLFAQSPENETFSYQRAWPRHFLKHPAFACTAVNVADRRWHARLHGNLIARMWRGDLVVILHSVFSNACLLTGPLFDAVRSLPQPKSYFIGNEYKFMPEKMAFCESLGVSLLVSQSTSPEVHRLYADRLKCQVTGVPNTGLDPDVFQSTTPPSARPIDIGYRADDVPVYLGHNERRRLADYFTQNAERLGLRVDISLKGTDRFAEKDWAAFLNRCRGQLGSEAGGDFFTLDDDLRDRINQYVKDHRAATVEEIHGQFFSGPQPPGIPLRILSGRHVEAAGTGTAQILLEGRYDGYLEPDEHYIPLKKDLSNADEAIQKFRDDGFRERITKNAHAVAIGQLTYSRLIDRFRLAVSAGIGDLN